MKVVFLLQSDPYLPKPCLRALREARTLREAGWEVRYVSWIQHGGDVSEGVRAVRIEPPALGRPLGRLRAYREVTQALALAVIEERPDLIVAHDLEVLRAGVAAKNVLNVHLLYDSHEDWPALIAENSLLESKAAKWAERAALPQVDAVLTVSEPLAEKFRSRGKRTTVLYNARHPDEITILPKRQSKLELGFDPSDFVVGYVGAAGDGYGVEYLREAEGVRTLVVSGVPYSELPRYYAAMDLGVILLDDRPNHRIALPNKLFDYMAYGVPVLAPSYPAIGGVVLPSGCGVLVDEVNEPSVRHAVRWASENRDYLLSCGEAGRKAYLEGYSWEHGSERFLRVVEGVIDEGAAAPPPASGPRETTETRG